MPKGPPALLQHIRQLAAAQPCASLPDRELVERFASQGDARAFEGLVRRHGPAVWGVCRRLSREQDAEDAFQATFLVLAKKAAARLRQARFARASG
jgi:DNA-directed RNA polymerase specialized sigma24 family protein